MTTWTKPPWQLVEGVTAPIRFRLDQDGVPVPLAGLTVTLLLADRTGTTVVTATVGAGTLVIIDDGTPALAGILEYRPSAADLTVARSVYTVRVKLQDGAGKIDYYPRTMTPPELRVGRIV